MTAAEFALAIGGLICALIGEAIIILDYRDRRPPFGEVLRNSGFWGLLGLVLCQVLWIVRLVA
jgi:hypothetical protein